ncbi:MAG TPA: hypothetical protein VIV60_10530 [Polyangiaceae bacterium]
MRILRGAALCVLCLSLGCSRQITRITHGTAHLEREISPRAYAAFARARLEESKGNAPAAIAGYREVLRLDIAASEAWMRIGILLCKRGDANEAARAFECAERMDPESARLFAAKADCALTRRDARAAVEFATTALAFAPADAEISRLFIRALSEQGSREQALRYGWSHVAMFPNDSAGWLVLSRLLHSSPRIERQVLRRAAQHSAVMSGTAQLSVAAQTRAELDLLHGLAVEDSRATQRAARDLRLGTVELANLTTELGAIEFAYAQADLAVAIEPEDPHRWLQLLILADWLGKDDTFDELLRHPPETNAALSDVERTKLLELVQRRAASD